MKPVSMNEEIIFLFFENRVPGKPFPDIIE
jgi:hypothetical protein